MRSGTRCWEYAFTQTTTAPARTRPRSVVAGDLRGAIPGEVALDLVSGDDRAHELLVVPGESPHPQRALLAVALRGRGEVLGDAREKEARVSPARSFGDRASLKHDRLRTCACEVVRGRDPGNDRADARGSGRGIDVVARVD